MNSKTLCWAVRTIVVLVLAVATSSLAQERRPSHLSGTINDFTAQTGSGPTVGPWIMHGVWSLTLNETGTADFRLAMTMEEGDFWLAANNEDPTQDPSVRSPHTHHITLKGASVSSDTSVCPSQAPATGRFVVTGLADITGNGNPAPFQTKSGLSKLYVCISGGTDVQYSNVTLQFESGSPATTHFGSQAIHGVVRKVQFGDAD